MQQRLPFPLSIRSAVTPLGRFNIGQLVCVIRSERVWQIDKQEHEDIRVNRFAKVDGFVLDSRGDLTPLLIDYDGNRFTVEDVEREADSTNNWIVGVDIMLANEVV